jgi:hypothetical protein
MDLNKLSANERLGAIAAAVAVVAGLVSALTYGTYAVAWLAIVAGLVMLFVIFQPQIAPNASLPGSKGSLLLLIGGIAGVVMLLAFLVNIGFTFTRFGFTDVLYMLTVAAALVMAWVGWQEFQAEGGQFQLGSSGAASTSAPPPVGPTSASAAPPPSPAEAPPPSTAPPPAAPPSATPEEPRRDDRTPGA